MKHQALSSFIWTVADLLRCDYERSEYGRVILPCTLLRRLDCVLDGTKPAVVEEFDAGNESGSVKVLGDQALGSERVRERLKEVLLGPAQFYESLRARLLKRPSRSYVTTPSASRAADASTFDYIKRA